MNAITLAVPEPDAGRTGPRPAGRPRHRPAAPAQQPALGLGPGRAAPAHDRSAGPTSTTTSTGSCSRPGRAAGARRGHRSRFIEAFHNLLALCCGVLPGTTTPPSSPTGSRCSTRCKETHLLLTEGAHNQYGDLPWTARHEMLMNQWILARPEMREFLPTRTMVPTRRPGCDRVEAMNQLQGWTDISVLHFRDLGGVRRAAAARIRFGDWSVGHRAGAGGELGPLLARGGAAVHATPTGR